jgi:hypothetical protein
VLAYFREQGREGGKRSGSARMLKLTPERRSEMPRKQWLPEKLNAPPQFPGARKRSKAQKEGAAQ